MSTRPSSAADPGPGPELDRAAKPHSAKSPGYSARAWPKIRSCRSAPGRRKRRTDRFWAGRGPGQRRHEHREDFINCVAPDPGLDAKPATRNERPQQRRDICAFCPEGGAAIDREGNAVLRSGMSVEHHRDEDDQVAEKNR